MRAPDFWNHNGFLPRLLTPLGALYAFGGRLKICLTTPQQAPIPVICIGNLVAGGAGKTPVALEIIKRLQGTGLEVHALTRGYGGKERGPLKVEIDRHDASDVGDEALLLARQTRTWVSRDRPAGARAAAADGADIIVMDDGFQNPSLNKDLSFVVIDSDFGLGNGRVMPAGPLREVARQGLERADAVVLLGNANPALETEIANIAVCPVLPAELIPGSAAQEFAGTRVLAFAGIGRPDKFYATLRALSANVMETRNFPDHHPYSGEEIDQLLERAENLNALAVTTEKDAMRLSSNIRSRIAVLPVEVSWRDPDQIESLLGPLTKGRSVSG
jgi:tetraacyldisaccharide 4'-kinase